MRRSHLLPLAVLTATLLLSACQAVPNTVALRAPDGAAPEPAAALLPTETALLAPPPPAGERDTTPPSADELAAPLAGLTYQPPLTITEGGTYRGNWESEDPGVPAVRVSTTEPVVIEGSNLRGRGHLIEQGVGGIDLTVRDTRGQALNPDRAGRPMGRFARLDGARRVMIEHNDLVGTAGILLANYGGSRSGADTFTITGNRARNIDGRMSNGSGAPGAAGYYESDDWCQTFDGSCQGVDFVQFVQLVQVQGVAGIEIAGNEIVNEPGASRTEDVISVYNSSGTADSPIRIVGNFIEGAYPQHPERETYSGGGIMLGDGEDGVAHVVATGNHVLNTTNYGIAISAGHDMTITGNRVLSDGLLPDGTPAAAQNVGIYVWDYHDVGGGAFYDNVATGNLAGWERPLKGSRQDWWLPDASDDSGNQPFSGAVTAETLDDEYALWLAEIDAAGATVGAAP